MSGLSRPLRAVAARARTLSGWTRLSIALAGLWLFFVPDSGSWVLFVPGGRLLLVLECACHEVISNPHRDNHNDGRLFFAGGYLSPEARQVFVARDINHCEDWPSAILGAALIATLIQGVRWIVAGFRRSRPEPIPRVEQLRRMRAGEAFLK